MDLIDEIEVLARTDPNAFHIELEGGGALGFAGVMGDGGRVRMVALAAEDPNEYYASVTMSIEEAMTFAKELVALMLRISTGD